MIPAQPGTLARFKDTETDRPRWYTRVVVAWDDDGYAMVLVGKGGVLRRACAYDNFVGVEADEEPSPRSAVQIIPGGGWSVSRLFAGSATDPLVQLVIAWAVCHDGVVRPVVAPPKDDITAECEVVEDIEDEWTVSLLPPEGGEA